MSDDRVVISVELDTTQAEADITRIEHQTDAVVEKWARDEREIQRSILRLNAGIRGIVGVIRNAYRMVGVTLDPVQEAVVNMITTTLGSILAMHRAMEAGSLGIAGIYTVGASIASIAIAGAAMTQAIAGMDESRKALDNAQALLDSITTTLGVFY